MVDRWSNPVASGNFRVFPANCGYVVFYYSSFAIYKTDVLTEKDQNNVHILFLTEQKNDEMMPFKVALPVAASQ